MPIFGQKKCQFCQTYTILLAKKVNRKSPFYFDFHKKIIYLMPIWQKCPFSKKYPALMLICGQKTSILWKTRCSHVIFFFNFSGKTHVVMPIFGQKSVNSVKTTLDYGPKKSIGWPFFRFLIKNHCQKTSIFIKARPSHIFYNIS